MKRFIRVFAVGLMVAAVGASAAVAGAQTGDLEAFCAARVEIEGAQTKKENLVVLDKLVDAAPDEIRADVTKVRKQFAKKGYDAYEGPAVARIDVFIYENCPGNQVEFTALDYEYVDAPASLAAGPTNFKLTNDAPKENHEIGIVKLTPEGEGADLLEILSLPEKKQGRYFDFENATGAFAPAGTSGYGLTTLEPGTYAYACSVNVGGKKKGAPHFTKGMYGTFVVQ